MIVNEINGKAEEFILRRKNGGSGKESPNNN
jgi:hypothetical protein